MRILTILFFLVITITLEAQVINYDWPITIPKSDLYQIRVFHEGNVYNIHPHLSTPYKEENWYYADRDLGDGDNNGVASYLQDRSMTFGAFSFEGEVWIEVTKMYGEAASRVEIGPKIFGINPTYFDGHRVRFKVSHDLSDIAKYIAVDFISEDNLDDDAQGGKHIKNSLMIFADKPETDAPNPDDFNVAVFGEVANYESADIIYFRKGDYNLFEYFNSVFGQEGQMPYFKNDQTIYLEPGTFIRGAFHGQGFDGITLKGRAIITGQNYPFHWFRDENDKKDAFINFIGCDDVTIDGIIIENPSHHTIPSSKRTKISNLKIIGWSYNQDGIRPSAEGVADQIFIKTNDDYDYARDPHLVKNSVFWPTHNGAVGMLGWNDLGTGYAEYINNTYINCETRNVNNNTGIIGSQAKDGMSLRENYLENLFIEDDNAYLVNVTITNNNDGPIASGFINDFTFKNITTEYPFQFPNKNKALQRMNGLENNWLTGWNFINVIIDGVLLTFENHSNYFNMQLQGSNGTNEDADNYVRNVTFGTEGTLYEIAASIGAGGTIHPAGENGTITCIGDRDQSVSIVPNDGYRISTITIDGEVTYQYQDNEKTEREQSVVFEEVSENHTIDVTFEQGDDYFGPGEGVSDLTGNFGAGVINLSWFDNSNEETSVKVYRLEGEQFTEIANLAPNTVSFEDDNLNSAGGYSYYVEAFNGSQSLGASNEVVLSVVLDAPSPEAAIQLYPNPVKVGSVFSLRLQDAEQYERIAIYQIDGRLISEQPVTKSVQTIQLNEQGILLMKIFEKNGDTHLKKIILK